MAKSGRKASFSTLDKHRKRLEEQLRKFGYHEDSPSPTVQVSHLPPPPLNLETGNVEP